MNHIRYIILTILISLSSSIKENKELCEDYIVNNDLKECFDNIVPEHHFCCGLNISFSSNQSLISCENIIASNISINLFKEHLIEEFNNSFEFICPEKEEEINGTCEEFINFPVEDGNKCLSLIGEKDKTCCSVKYQMAQKIEEFPFPPNYTECISLPNDKSKNEEEIKNMKDRFNFEGLELVIKCGNLNKSNFLNYFNLISFLLISLLIL